MITTSTRVEDAKLTSEDRLRLHVGDPETFAFAYEDAAGLQAEIDDLRSELLDLREAVTAYGRERAENVSRLLRSLSQGAGHEQ